MRFAWCLLLCACDPAGKPPQREPPPGAVGGFAISLPEATLAPGEEKQPCYIFPLSVEGPSLIVGGATLEVGPGMHHGNITARKKTGEGMRKCEDDPPGGFGGEAIDVAQGGAVLFGSSTQVSGEE